MRGVPHSAPCLCPLGIALAWARQRAWCACAAARAFQNRCGRRTCGHGQSCGKSWRQPPSQLEGVRSMHENERECALGTARIARNEHHAAAHTHTRTLVRSTSSHFASARWRLDANSSSVPGAAARFCPAALPVVAPVAACAAAGFFLTCAQRAANSQVRSAACMQQPCRHVPWLHRAW